MVEWRNVSRPTEREGRWPACVGILIAGLVLQFVAAMLLLIPFGLSLVGQLASGEMWNESPARFGWVLGSIWLVFHVAISPSLVFGLAEQEPRAWAATFALLFCRTAGSALAFVAVTFAATQPGSWNSGGSAVLVLGVCLGVVGGLAASLFRSHAWFGISPKERWRTIRKRALWALLAGTLFEVVPVLLATFPIWTFDRNP